MERGTMSFDLAKNWWALAARGLAGIAFGLAALFWPLAPLAGSAPLFGAYALVDGIFNLFAATPARECDMPCFPVAVEGVISLIAAVVAVNRPDMAGFSLVVLIASWSILRGIAEAVAAFRLRRHFRRPWLLALPAVLSACGGLLPFAAKAGGAALVTTWLGAYAVAFGSALVALSPLARRAGRSAPTRMGVVLRMADYRAAGTRALVVAAGSGHGPRVT
jgi:uncharacterized membrane protein HdeD (DUF308 family)